jgi:3-oxoacyl-[acyl-carrier-protein] synthase-3
MIKAGQAKKIAVIGAEVMSRIVDWNDRNTCVLFGDGAGAVIVSDGDIDNGIIGINIASDGNFIDILKTNGGLSAGNLTGKLQMDGKEVFKFAIDKMTSSIASILETNGLLLSQLDWIVPHQANARIINALSERINFSHDKIALTIDKHANTSAASIPLALSCYIKNQLLKKGDLVALTAVGAGMTWGAALLRI